MARRPQTLTMTDGDPIPAGQAASILLRGEDGRVLLRAGVPRIADEREIDEIVCADPAVPPVPLTNDARVALRDHASGRSGCRRIVARRA